MKYYSNLDIMTRRPYNLFIMHMTRLMTDTLMYEFIPHIDLLNLDRVYMETYYV